MNRRRAREVSLQALFQYDLNRDTDSTWIEQFVRGRLRYPELEAFALELVTGVCAHRVEIDRMLEEAADNWRVGRMAAVDRNLLRLAVFELKFQPDTPPKVVINEALELGKRYGGPESAAFVNGLLDRVAHDLVGPFDTSAPDGRSLTAYKQSFSDGGEGVMISEGREAPDS
jgi:N utilization substance protein B